MDFDGAVNYVQAAPPNGVASISVNIRNGNITVCPAINIASVTPTNTCKHVGTISISGTTEANQFQITTTNNSVATVTNLISGDVMMCSLFLDSTLTATGVCASGKLF